MCLEIFSSKTPVLCLSKFKKKKKLGNNVQDFQHITALEMVWSSSLLNIKKLSPREVK